MRGLKCSICDNEVEDNEGGVCDRCWYGMRMATEQWIASLKEEGIEVERGMGCQSFGSGFICGDPYKAKVKS
jgi:hypothetical protein